MRALFAPKHTIKPYKNYLPLFALILLSSFLNIAGSILARESHFPLYMDSFATIATASIAGLIPALLVAVLTNGTLFLLGHLKAAFILCQLMTALGSYPVFKIAKRHGEKKLSLDSFMFVGILSAFTNGISGSLFAAMYNYNLSAIEQGIFLVTNNILFANLAGGFFLNLVDKALASFIAYGIYLVIIKRLKIDSQNIGDKQKLKIKPEYIFLIAAFFALFFSFGFKTMIGNSFDDKYQTVSERIDEFETIRTYEKFINKGFDSLSYTSFILMAISVLIMQVRLNRRKNEIEILRTKEETKKRFSRDLHDGVIQSLAALKLCLSQSDAERAKFLADDAICKTRELLGFSRFDLSDDFINLVHQYVKVFEANYKIGVNVFEASSFASGLSSEIKYEILKILQEALTNAGKHSGSDKIEVKIIDTSSNFVMSVCDNGTGFTNTDTGITACHAGIKVMHERASVLGGEIKIKSDKTGTTVSLILPIRKK